MITRDPQHQPSTTECGSQMDHVLAALCQRRHRRILLTMCRGPRSLPAIAAEVESRMAFIEPDLDDLEELGLVEHWSGGGHPRYYPHWRLTEPVRIRQRGRTVIFAIRLPNNARVVMKHRLRNVIEANARCGR